MRILLVEDDRALSRIIAKHLTKELYVVDCAYSLEMANQKIADTEKHDLIILDVMLPDGNGVSLCRELRAAGSAQPILMLTTRSSTLDKITGLDSGADDYMPKPFSPNELSARIRALLRRPKDVLKEEIECGDITLNVLSRQVKVKGQPMQLMPKEFSLLEYLMRRKNQAVRKDELLRNVWGVYSNTSSNRLEVYIRYLREKLESFDNQAEIQTIRGLGYMIADE